MKRRERRYQLNNAGSAIVTVLVVVAFITILSTVMLYISGTNYQMKVTDYRTKESFYQAETPVEELRAQLIKDVQTAFAKAYTQAMSEYAGMSEAGMREANYRQLFYEALEDIWYVKQPGESEPRCPLNAETAQRDWKTGIQKVVQDASSGSWTVNVGSSPLDISQLDTDGRIILSNVEFIYDSEDHFVSVIKTDYCITIPDIDWGTSFSGSTANQMDFSEYVDYMNWTKN